MLSVCIQVRCEALLIMLFVPSWYIFKSLSLPNVAFLLSGNATPAALIRAIVAAESVPGACLACTYAESTYVSTLAFV